MFFSFRVSTANFAINLPWKGSVKQARKMKGRTLPFSSTVMPGAVATGAIRGTLLLVTTGVAAETQPLVAGPMMTETLSLVISLVAAFPEGSDLLSASTSLIFLPLMPPLALICSTANCTPL